jgi:hypothetical protein
MCINCFIPLVVVCYDGAIRPALLYGAGVWGERSEDTRIQKRLRAAQRSFLLGITKDYRTSSNVALEVLAGCVPLHIEAASAHSTWVTSKSHGFEGKAVFADGAASGGTRQKVARTQGGEDNRYMLLDGCIMRRGEDRHRSHQDRTRRDR